MCTCVDFNMQKAIHLTHWKLIPGKLKRIDLSHIKIRSVHLGALFLRAILASQAS